MRPNKWKLFANDRPSSVKICEKILWVVSCAEVRVNIGNNSTKDFPINLILRYARSVWMVWFICICYRKFQIEQIDRTSILGWLSVFGGRHFNSHQLLCHAFPPQKKNRAFDFEQSVPIKSWKESNKFEKKKNNYEINDQAKKEKTSAVQKKKIETNPQGMWCDLNFIFEIFFTTLIVFISYF